ncbi:NAD(P)-binding protein [Schizopora paradoxa]|uniref:NAD(P)-binding protein n=1 Tax=Schizopora paradoxa TaxID=27342 RepID=A0A0H2R0C8_9AGAM|nr:NAD(P)-binding protein [Schizopora paradoxa]
MAPGPNFKDELKGHKAVIIGGSRGIGLGVAEAFLSYGAHVHIIGFSERSVIVAVDLLSEEYPDSHASSLISGSTSDVRDESRITEALLKLAPVDHIVYTAVDARIRGPIAEEDIKLSQDLFGVKFWGQVAVAKAIAKHDIVNPGGSYTITSGTLSLKPKLDCAVGGALNSAVNALAKGLALDLAHKKVRVNAVIPGFVISPHDAINQDPITPERKAFLEKAGAGLPTGNGVGSTEDIAEAYIYFARAKFTTGTLAVVDGGALLL